MHAIVRFWGARYAITPTNANILQNINTGVFLYAQLRLALRSVSYIFAYKIGTISLHKIDYVLATLGIILTTITQHSASACPF